MGGIKVFLTHHVVLRILQCTTYCHFRRLKNYGFSTSPEIIKDTPDEKLNFLGDYLVRVEEFNRNERAISHLGALFDGMNTNWELLENVLRWVKAVREAGLSYQDVHQLWALSENEESSSSYNVIKRKVEQFSAELNNELLKSLLNNNIISINNRRFCDIRDFVLNHIEVINKVEGVWSELSFQGSTSMTEDDENISAVLGVKLSDFYAKIFEYEKILNRLGNFGPAFAGFQTDWTFVENLMVWINAIKSVGLSFDQVQTFFDQGDLIVSLGIPSKMNDNIMYLKKEIDDTKIGIFLGLPAGLWPSLYLDILEKALISGIENNRILLENYNAFLTTNSTTLKEILNYAEITLTTRDMEIKIISNNTFCQVLGFDFDHEKICPVALQNISFWIEKVISLGIPTYYIELLCKEDLVLRSAKLANFFRKLYLAVQDLNT